MHACMHACMHAPRLMNKHERRTLPSIESASIYDRMLVFFTR